MSTRIRLSKLRMSSPAPTTSVTAIAISATTSDERNQTRAPPAVVRVLASLTAWLTLPPRRCRSGTSANTRPVVIVTASVKASTA